MQKTPLTGNRWRTYNYLDNCIPEKVLVSLIGKDSPIIHDVGANIGKSLKEYYRIWPNSEIYSFEPLHECQDHLQRLKTEFASPQIHIINAAVGNITNTIFVISSFPLYSNRFFLFVSLILQPFSLFLILT